MHHVSVYVFSLPPASETFGREIRKRRNGGRTGIVRLQCGELLTKKVSVRHTDPLDVTAKDTLSQDSGKHSPSNLQTY